MHLYVIVWSCVVLCCVVLCSIMFCCIVSCRVALMYIHSHNMIPGQCTYRQRATHRELRYVQYMHNMSRDVKTVVFFLSHQWISVINNNSARKTQVHVYVHNTLLIIYNRQITGTESPLCSKQCSTMH